MIFPADWQEMTLGDFVTVQMCRRIFQNQTSEFGEIPFYKIGTFGKKADAYISRKLYEEYKKKYSYPEKGDILISAAGTIGKTIIFDGEESYFQDSNIVWLKVNKNIIDRQFLWWFCRSITWQNLEGSTIKRLYNSIILNTKIHVPPLAEQKEIVKVLSAFDNYIDALGALIAKKKDIRNAALEELMSRKIRLQGFSGVWQKVKLGEIIVKSVGGGTPDKSNRKYWNGSIAWMSVKDFANVKNGILYDTIDHITEAGVKNSSTKVVDEKAIILCTRMGLGKCAKIARPVAINQDLCAVWLADNILDRYFIAAYSTLKILGAGSTVKGISRKELFSYSIPLPPLAEQKAIAEILTAIDDNIAAQTAEREKVIAMRAGAMEQLLTGQIRLQKE